MEHNNILCSESQPGDFFKNSLRKDTSSPKEEVKIKIEKELLEDIKFIAFIKNIDNIDDLVEEIIKDYVKEELTNREKK